MKRVIGLITWIYLADVYPIKPHHITAKPLALKCAGSHVRSGDGCDWAPGGVYLYYYWQNHICKFFELVSTFSDLAAIVIMHRGA